MSKTVKTRLISGIIFTIAGILFFICPLADKKGIFANEDLRAYMYGVSAGIMGCGIAFVISAVRLMKSPEKARERQNMDNDERLISINNEAMAWTFKISICMQALLSITFAFAGEMEFAKYLGLAIAIHAAVYLIVYLFLTKKS